MRTMRITATILALAVSAGLAAESGNTGKTGALFLTLPGDPRSAALGGAVSALPENPFASLCNPAAGAYAEGLELGLSHTVWFQGFYYETLSLRLPLSFATLGATAVHFSDLSDDVTFYDACDAALSDPYETRDLAVGLSAAFLLPKYVAAGASLKFIYRTLGDETAMAAAFDAGAATMNVGIEGLAFGASLRNIGYATAFRGEDGESDAMPLEGRLGVSYRALGFEKEEPLFLTVAIECVIPSYYSVHGALGVEAGYRAAGLVAGILRAGYHYPEDGGALSGLSVGAGLESLKGIRAGLDYALTFHGPFGATHHIGLRYTL